MSKLHELARLGQSIWYDNIRRALIDSGELQALLDDGVTGVTSNPSIFEKAIAGSADYDEAILAAGSEQTAEQIYESLVLADIGRTADYLRPVYDRTKGADGYVSLEVSPTLAHDTAATIADARRFYAALDRPNVMIKVPATPAGMPAIEALIGEGINVNVTLIFSLAHYEAVAEAYLCGLEKRAAAGEDISQVASVASFFISRVDTVVDRLLSDAGDEDLLGKIGIANARAAYARFQEIFSGERWQTLAAKGAKAQRPLWASTGAKNPAYPDTLYIDQLIGKDTVNTVPPAALNAFLDHGSVANTLGENLGEAQAKLAQLAALGVGLEAITQNLQDEGVAAFAKSFHDLLRSIVEKRQKLQANQQDILVELGEYQGNVSAALKEVQADAILKRIWAHDYKVWRPVPDEISNRLGWLHTAERMMADLERLQDLASDVRAERYTRALLLGMGGSSMAPEVFRKAFGVQDGYLDLAVLDSTDPAAVSSHAAQQAKEKTLFIVATKSGGTAETLSFFKYFYNQVAAELGLESAGQHFVAITDPGSKLEALGKQFQFRDIFLNDPNIGGRYSALSYFGLVPAALLGVDLETLLNRALIAACNSESCNDPLTGDNRGALLGASMGELAKAGRDKITFVVSPAIASFGNWVEQLIAESTGKDGKGILPVVTEPVGNPEEYGSDRLFVYLRLEGDATYDRAVQALREAGHPLVTIHLDDVYDLGQHFFLWEMATAVAGYRLDINPFDQPNVEAAKVLARQTIAAYQATGTLPQGVASPLSRSSLESFLSSASPGDYVAIQAYVQPTAETSGLLESLSLQIRQQYKMATTIGYGPRFLHSTGQLHKGDRGNGLFIQFTSNSEPDLPIPDQAGEDSSSISFGVLKMAQAVGDGQALLDANRRVIRFHLGHDVNRHLARLIEG